MQIIFQAPTFSDYLYIHVNMPQLCDFDPRPAALRWMEEKDRRARENTKAGKQEWFNNVFAKDDKEDEEVRKLSRRESFEDVKFV